MAHGTNHPFLHIVIITAFIIIFLLQSASTNLIAYFLLKPMGLCFLHLRRAHDESGHQGTDRIMARLLKVVYWIGMSKDVSSYYNHCLTCQQTKALTTHPAPLQPVVAS